MRWSHNIKLPQSSLVTAETPDIQARASTNAESTIINQVLRLWADSVAVISFLNKYLWICSIDFMYICSNKVPSILRNLLEVYIF